MADLVKLEHPQTDLKTQQPAGVWQVAQANELVIRQLMTEFSLTSGLGFKKAVCGGEDGCTAAGTR